MEIAFILGLIIGLPICFYGVYFYKIYIAITTFISALIAEIIIFFYILYGDMTLLGWLGILSGDEDAELILIAAFIIAIILAFLAAKYEKIFTVVGMFLFFFSLIIVCLSFVRGLDVVSFLIAWLVGCIIGFIVYKLHFYMIVFMTAFTGALIYSLGTSPTFASPFDTESAWLNIFLLQLILFSVAGTVYQVHYWAKRSSVGKADVRTAGKFVFSKGAIPKIDCRRYIDEVAHNWKLFIFPLVIFLVFLVFKENIPFSNYSEYIFNSILVIEMIVRGIFMASFLAIAKTHSHVFGLLYMFPYWIQLLWIHSGFSGIGEMGDSSIEVFLVLFGYIIAWIILKILYKYVSTGWKIVIPAIIVLYILNYQMTGIIAFGFIYGSVINTSFRYVFSLIPVIGGGIYFYYRNAEIKIVPFSKKAITILFSALVIITVVAGEFHVAKFYLIPDLRRKWENAEEKKEVEEDKNKAFDGYDGEIGKLAHYLNGTWIDDNGSIFIYDEETGRMILYSKVAYVDDADYEYYMLEYQEEEADYNKDWFYESINGDESNSEDYHYWWVSVKGEDVIYEITCDYRYREFVITYGILTDDGYHQTAVSHFYTMDEEYSKDGTEENVESDTESEEESDTDVYDDTEEESDSEDDVNPEEEEDISDDAFDYANCLDLDNYNYVETDYFSFYCPTDFYEDTYITDTYCGYSQDRPDGGTESVEFYAETYEEAGYSEETSPDEIAQQLIENFSDNVGSEELLLNHSTDEESDGNARVAISGKDFEDNNRYDAYTIDENYIYTMSICFRPSSSDEEANWENYYIDCLYRGCSFTRDVGEMDTYEDYLDRS